MQPGDDSEVQKPNVVKIPSESAPKSPKVPFKEQVVGAYSQKAVNNGFVTDQL